MNLARRKTNAASLSEWLEIATAGLTATAREKIEREISAHYLDSVETHRAKGETDEAAQAGALAELGNPGKAASKFTAEYVTEADEKFLAYLHTTAFKPWNNCSVLTCLAVLTLINLFNLMGVGYAEAPWVFFFQKHPDFMLAATLGVFLITCVLLPRYSYLAARKSSLRVATSRRLLNIELFRWFILLISWSILAESPLRGLSYLIVIILSDRSSRLRAKLRKQQKSEPGKPTTA